MHRCTTHCTPTDPRVMITGPLPAPKKCKSGSPRITETCPGVMKTKFLATVMFFGLVSSEGHIMPPHIFEVGLKVNIKVYLDVLRSVVIPWCNQMASGSRTRHWPYKSKETQAWLSEGVLWLCTLLSLVPLLSRPEPAGLLCLVIRREHHQHDFPQNLNQPDRRHLPSICWAPTGACGKGMPPVLDPYRGGDWSWRWLHWIDASSTT